MKNILISQKVKKKTKGYGFILEDNWNKFFLNSKMRLVTLKLDEIKKKKIDKLKLSGLILHGGNDLPNLINKRENKIRKKIDTFLFRYAMSNKIPILAVCYGFQLVAQHFGSSLKKKTNHVKKNHLLNLNLFYKNNFYDTLKVNSYHNFVINRLSKEFNYICRHMDGSIELAVSKKYKILCCMFHPERKSPDIKKQRKLVISHFYKG